MITRRSLLGGILAAAAAPAFIREAMKGRSWSPQEQSGLLLPDGWLAGGGCGYAEYVSNELCEVRFYSGARGGGKPIGTLSFGGPMSVNINPRWLRVNHE